MGFSTIFIRRPIATSLLMAGLLLLGILGYRKLPVSALPEIDAPSLVVTTQYPGANATTMASLVTTPLERQFGQISGLELMTSDSSAGLSTIILQFSMDRDIDIAAQDVQAAIRQATLPSSLPYQPVYNRVNPADAAIVTLKLTSDTRPLRDVNNYADSILAQRLSQVQGVGLVSIAGNVRPAVRIQVNPAQLSNMGLTLEQLRSALTQANVNAPKGSLNGKTQSYSIGTNDQLASAAEYRDTIISYKNGRPVRLSDVAEVIDGVENDQLAAWADGKPAVLLEVRRQPGANIVQTVERIRAILPQLQGVLPADVHLEIFNDRTETIRASVHEVQFTLILTIGLVVAVIFVFLRRLWATIIPSVAVPLSLAGTFAVMAFAGMSLDNLSLMALVVATGFVVDDAIVMIENIVRYIEQGKSGKEAAEIGARQIGFTVLSLTVSLVAVFLPLLLMPGVTGRLFHEFAWVLSIAVVLSMLISLTLTPMMCAYLLKPDALPEGEDAHERAAAAGKQNLWTRTVGLYEHSLDWVLGHQRLTLAVAGGALVLTVLLYVLIPKGLLPEQDTGLITGVVQADQNIAFPQMEQRTRQVAEALRQDPDVTGVSAFIGAGSMNPTLNQGQLSIVLKERSQRDGLEQILPRLQKAVAGIPGVALYLKPVQDVTLDTRVAATEYQYSLSDVDSATVATQATRLTEALRKRPELADVDNNLSNQGRALELNIDRDKASVLGVPMQTIDDTLYDAFGQRQISTIYSDINQYSVVVNALPSQTATPAALDEVYVRARNGDMVPITAVATQMPGLAPSQITHENQYTTMDLSYNLAPNVSMGEAKAIIDATVAGMRMPGDIRLADDAGFGFNSDPSDMLILVFAAILTVYLVLGMLYESLIHPVTILSTLPAAGVGALLALFGTNTELSVISMIALVLLIGIVKKNAIMMIDFALVAQREHGLAPRDAAREASIVRFRPIMMTTMVAILAAVPLAIGLGEGSELRRPLGIAMIGGLLFSQSLTLLSTPALYVIFSCLAERWRARRARRREAKLLKRAQRA